MNPPVASTPAEKTSANLDSTLAMESGVQGREALHELEQAAIAARRGVALPDAPDSTRVGLALSGGGIRSATFCFGLLRGFAQNGLLPRIDYLSTVSGGGYAGAALTRLIRQAGIAKAQQVFARSDSFVLEWLRRNGRYLTPRGARDVGMAVATYFRSALAAHVDVAVLSLLAGVIIILPHTLHSDFALVLHEQWRSWPSAWWAAAVAAWMLTGPSTLPPYWMMHDRPDGKGAKGQASSKHAVPKLRDVICMATIAAAAVLLGQALWRSASLPLPGPSLALFAEFFLIGTLLRYGSLLLRLWKPSGDFINTRHAQQRSRLTRALRRANLVALVLFALGAVDLLTWKVKLMIGEPGQWLVGGLSLGTALIVLRAFSEPLQKMATASDGPQSRWIPQMLNVFGIAVGLIVFCAWVVLVQWLVFTDLPAGAESGVLSIFSNLQYWMRAAAIGAFALLWILLTAPNRDTVNSSSLHGFYRARLVRAYLAVGNPARFGEHFNGEGSTPGKLDVTEVIPGDDNEMAHHTPEQQGGPIHLVGTCLNQTREAASGLYNADRKGMAATVSARGIELGNDKFVPAGALEDFGTLGRWTAISGAAASPGAGAYTTRGWAALLFMLGARLGYWFRPFRKPWAEKPTPDPRWRRFRRKLGSTKFGLLASEALASFAGMDRMWWYFSDGGHFDNTGVHALLQRQLDFIILADCGADAKFEYGDIENLVRKARIDFDADIEFYSDEGFDELQAEPNQQISVLSPEQLSKNYTERGVLLARICYCRSQPQCRKVGTLLVVKPNLHVALDGDVLAYARRNPAFPHQSTGDQFFDEAQWESHHRLGEDVGRALTPAWLAQLPGWKQPARVPEPFAPLRKPVKKNGAASDAAPTAFWRPETKAAALGATLGIGALGTVMLPTLQLWEALKTRADEKETRVTGALDRSGQAFRDPTDGSLLTPTPDSMSDLRVIRDAVRSGDMSRLVRTRATRLIDEVEGTCSTVETSFSQCEFVAHPVCIELCRPMVDDYWRPSPRWRIQDNPLMAWLGFTGSAAPLRPQAYAQPEVVAEAQVPTSQAELPADDPPVVESPVADPPVADAPVVEPEDAPESPVLYSPIHPVEEACVADGQPMTLYVQVYDEETRARAQTFEARALFGEGVRVPGVENVVHTSQARGETPPAQWSRPTLLVHRPAQALDQACAVAIAGSLEQYTGPVDVRDLPASLVSKRRVVELWLPPETASRQ